MSVDVTVERPNGVARWLALLAVVTMNGATTAARAQDADVTVVPVYATRDPHPRCPAHRFDTGDVGADDDSTARRGRVDALAGAPAVIRESVRRARAALAGHRVVVCLRLARPGRPLDELGGVSGFAAGNVIHLFVDPGVEGWLDVLPFTVAHEYHHTAVFARRLQPGERTVLWRLVFEGKADVFASELHPAVRRPWHAPYAADDEQRCVSQLRERLDQPASTPEFRNDLMIAWTGRAPRFCGYWAGRRLVLAFRAEHPDHSAERWSRATPDEIARARGSIFR